MSKVQQSQQTHAQKPASKKVEQVQKPQINAAQLLDAPESLRPEDVLAAQQQVGNQVVQRSLDNTVQRDDEELKSLGGGSANQVYKVTRPDGPTGFFKPNSQHDPQMGARAVLSSTIDKTLGMNVLAKETYKKYSGEKTGTGVDTEGSESSEVKGRPLLENDFNTPITKDTYDAISDMAPATVKEKVVDGQTKHFKQSGSTFMRHDFSNPQTQKDLANIHLQDSITGQNDRHGGNIRIDDETGEAKGYDSDLMAPLQRIDQSSLSNLPNLHKPKGLFSKKMTSEEKDTQKESRIKALQTVNSPTDKYLGLPSHIDETSAQKMIGMNSKKFISSLKKSDPENMKRLDPEQIEELRNRYSTVRRYAKAGVAMNAPDLVQDKKKLAKWSDPSYQETVQKGAGMVPSIVQGGWGRETYNEQVNVPSTDEKKYHSYLQQGVKTYNEAQTGNNPGYVGENSDQGPLPTNIPETPWQGAKTNKRHGMRISPGKLRGPMVTMGQRSPRTPPPTTTQDVHQDDSKSSEEQAPPLRPLARIPPPPDTNRVDLSKLRNRPLPKPPVQQTITDSEEVKMQSEGRQRRKNVTGANGELVPEINDAIQKKRGGGSSLPESVQKEAKKALGRDFKDVRIHTDEEAHRLSRSISARAFTIGKDIFFKQGVFAPGTSAGRETIIHELTHVVQQSQGAKSGGGALKLGAPDTAHEKEADNMGKRHAAKVSALGIGAVQRAPEEDEIMMQGDEDDWDTDPEPVSQSKPEPISRERLGELSGQLVKKMQAGAVSQGLAKSSIPKAPPPPLPKRPAPAPAPQSGFGAEIAAKAKSMNSPKQRRKIEKLENTRSEKVGARVSEQYKEDQATKPKSFGSKLKGFAGKAAKFGAGKLKDYGKNRLSEYGKHFLNVDPVKAYEKFQNGDKDDKKDAKPAGGGVGEMMEKYSEILQENKKLKAELASLKE